MTKRQFINAQMTVAAGFMCMNLGNYLTSLLAGRVLPDTTFASYVALTSFLSVLTVSGSFVQPMISKRVAESTDLSASEITNRMLRYASAVAVSSGVLAILSFPLIARLAGDNAPELTLVSGSYVVSSIVLPALVGMTQGSFRFFDFAIAFSVGGLSRPLFFIIFVYQNPTLLNAMLSVLSSTLITAMILINRLPNKKGLLINFVRPRVPRVRASMVYSLGLMSAISVMCYSDVIIARLRLPEDELRSFAAASLFSNITLYGSLSVASVLIPFASRRDQRRDNQTTLPRISMVLTLITGLVVTLLLAISGTWLINFTMGFQSVISNFQLAIYSAVFSGVAVIVLAANYELATANRRSFSVFLLSAAICLVALLALFGESASSIISVDLAVVSAVLIGIAFTRGSLMRPSTR